MSAIIAACMLSYHVIVTSPFRSLKRSCPLSKEHKQLETTLVHVPLF